MNHYNVYGLGNALVDFEFAVEDEVLSTLGIDKGLMTLIDEPRQLSLLERLSTYEHKKASGGSAANSIIAISQFGGRAYYSCKLAADEAGDFYLQDLRDCGVASHIADSARGAGHTGKCVVLVTPDAERTMSTFLGVSADLSSRELSPEAIASSDYLYIEGYLASSETACAAAIEARGIAMSAQKKIALTLSDPNMVRFFKDNLQAMIGSGVDLLFCNDAEALEMTATSSIDQAVVELRRYARSLCVTLGAKGALIVDGGHVWEIPAQPATAIDTNGAGDMFAGAYLYGVTNGMSSEASGRLATRAAAAIVSVFGPRLSQQQFRELLNGFAP